MSSEVTFENESTDGLDENSNFSLTLSQLVEGAMGGVSGGDSAKNTEDELCGTEGGSDQQETENVAGGSGEDDNDVSDVDGSSVSREVSGGEQWTSLDACFEALKERVRGAKCPRGLLNSFNLLLDRDPTPFELDGLSAHLREAPASEGCVVPVGIVGDLARYVRGGFGEYSSLIAISRQFRCVVVQLTVEKEKKTKIRELVGYFAH